MQIRSLRGSGEPARVIALSNARDGLGPDPRRAWGPAAIRAASTGRTRDRTRPMLQKRQKVLARPPSTRDPGCLKTQADSRPGIFGTTVMQKAKEREIVFRSALRPNRTSILHDQDPNGHVQQPGDGTAVHRSAPGPSVMM